MVGRIAKLLFSLSFCPFLLLWRNALALLGVRSQSPHVVLMYHQVSENDRSRFALQMDSLLRIAVPVPLMDSNPEKKWGLRVSVTFDDGIRNLLQNAIPELVERGIPATLFFPTAYLGKFPDWISDQDPTDETRWVMTVEEARSLPSDLTLIGSHSVHHKKLNRLELEEIKTELVDSKRDLEKALNRSVETFAFPYGEYDNRVVRAAQEAGYLRAYAANPVWVDGFVAGRIDVEPHDWPLEFLLKTLGAYRWLPAAIILKGFLVPRK